MATPTARAARAAQPTLTGSVAWPGDLRYEQGRRVFNSRFDRYPAGIVFCTGVEDVRNAVAWATRQGLQVSVRSGGHSYEGYSVLDDRLLLDLGGISGVVVDHAAGTATLGPGLRLRDCYRALAAEGVTIAAGTCPGVGLGGLTLGGGVGFRSRRDGLTCDALLGADVVLADGTAIHASGGDHPDLFWALRGGGGGNAGIAASLTFRTTPARDVSMATVTWPWDEAAPVIAAWQAWAPDTDERLASSLAIFRPQSDVIGFTGVMLGPRAELESLLAPLLAVGSPTPSLRTLSWLEAAEELAGSDIAQIAFKNSSGFAYRPLPPEAISHLITAMTAPPSPSNLVGFFAFGGAIARVASGATAFAHRQARFVLQYQAYWQEAWEEAANVAWVNDLRAALAPYTSGAYVNYIDADQPDWAGAYYGPNLSRLAGVKARYDPGNLFSTPQSVPGLATA